jgi:hypothetical protein
MSYRIQSMHSSHLDHNSPQYSHIGAEPVRTRVNHQILQHCEVMQTVFKKSILQGECDEWQLDWPVDSEMALQ